MDVQVSVEDNQIVVTPSGELDAHNCGELGDALAGASESPSTPVVVDAQQLTFIDSSAISELLRLREQREEAGGDFTMTNVQPSVRRVLEITGLLDTFGIS